MDMGNNPVESDSLDYKGIYTCKLLDARKSFSSEISFGPCGAVVARSFRIT